MNNTKYLSICCLLFVSCSIQSSIYFTKLRPLLSENTNPFTQDSLCLSLSFEGINNERLAIALEMINNTDNSISVQPALFYYKDLVKAKPDSMSSDRKYYSLDYKKEIDNLKLLKDSLSQAKNPYSKTRKKLKQHLKDGLIESTVELIMPGLSLGDMEKNRQEDEENWDAQRIESLVSTNSQLLFWKNSVLKDTILASNDTIQGCLLFPIDTTLKQILFVLPFKNKIFYFPFQQTFKR